MQPATIGAQPATLSLYDGRLDLATASHYVRLEPLVTCCVSSLHAAPSLSRAHGSQVRLTPEFHKQIVRLKKGMPACASPMSVRLPSHATASPRNGAHPLKPQSSPAALKVAGAPSAAPVAQHVESGPLVLRSATARRPGLLARVWPCSTHIQRSTRAAQIGGSDCGIAVSTSRRVN